MKQNASGKSGRRIEVCGGIASGKTTLVSALAGRDIPGFVPVFEDFQSNPFYQKFYSDPVKYAFETEVVFLMQHYSQLKDTVGLRCVVADYSLSLDLAYALTTLESSDHQLIESILARVLRSIARPDLILRASCSAQTQLDRVRARGRVQEREISIHYLENLNISISKSLKSKFFADTPVLEIDCEGLDFRYNSIDAESVIEQIVTKLDDDCFG